MREAGFWLGFSVRGRGDREEVLAGVSGFGFRVPGLGFRISGFGFRLRA